MTTCDEEGSPCDIAGESGVAEGDGCRDGNQRPFVPISASAFECDYDLAPMGPPW